MAEKRYTDYDAFAWVYNKHWGTQSHIALPVLERILFPRLTENARILDLCCGGGQIVEVLLERKYDAVGLDGSEKLLDLARENVPNGEFILADARNFKINMQFDAVISLYDSLNHVMTIEEMRCVLSAVFTHLKPGGYFVFDLNLEEAFNERWKNGSSSLIESDHVVAVKTDYDSDKKIGRFEAAIFKQAGHWQRTDVTLLQKCYNKDEIVNELKATGFKQVKIIDTYAEFNRGAKGRPYFSGQKPPGR